MPVQVTIKALPDLIEKAESNRGMRRLLRKALREAAKATKANVQARARGISKRLARRVKVTVDRKPVPHWARVTNTYAGANAIEAGRRPGAKMPPPDVLRGGVGAAMAVARDGVRARPFMAPAARDSRPDVDRALAAGGRAMEGWWRAKGRAR